jgi:cytoskeletal protein RodZ
VSIGEVLAEARRTAGLSVTQVSQQTRIRESIIRGIERDDFSGCGGDFYARGDIRDIARVTGADPAPLIREYDATRGAPEEITAAEAFRPVTPIRVQRRHRLNWTAVLGIALLVVIGVAAYHFITAARSTASPAAATKPASDRAGRPGGSHSPAAHSPSPSTTPSATTPSPRRLALASAAAFGPAGTSQGDNPAEAPLAIDGNPATAWFTDWYSTPRFGGDQSGTGLLIDLGQTDTITSVRLKLTSRPGGDLQLRAGYRAGSLADLHPVASVADASGALTLRLASPVRGRYLLIWFTKLPPDSTGTYQAGVYSVTVTGYR